jgi:hypothetical protein
VKTIIYAPGHGWGHLNRAMAIGACAPTGTDIEVWSSSPYVGIAAASAVLTNSPAVISGVDVKQLEGAVGQDDTLVVDAFPCGVAGELKYVLAKIAARKILVLRNLPERYAVATCGTVVKLTKFIHDEYDLVIDCESMGSFGSIESVRVDPIVMQSSLIPSGAQSQLLVIAGGNEDELDWYGEVCAELDRRAISHRCIAAKPPVGCDPDRYVRHWPAVDYVAQAKVVIGGAGYNTVHETRCHRVPLIAKAWPRRWDDQVVRAKRYAAAIATTPASAVDAIEQVGEVIGATPANGASQAAEFIWGCAPSPRKLQQQEEESCSI